MALNAPAHSCNARPKRPPRGCARHHASVAMVSILGASSGLALQL